MKKLSDKIRYAEAYLTFRCNLHCSYCINKESGLEDRKEMTGEGWLLNLNEIDFGDVPLTLGGGEPTQHPDFYKILNGLRDDIKVDLLTNLQFDIDSFIRQVSPDRFKQSDNPSYRSIRASFHPHQVGADDLVEKAVQLQDNGFKVGIFGINHPHNAEANMYMSEVARQKKIYFFIKDFLGTFKGQLHGVYKYPEGLDGKRKRVLCESSELLIAPDGDIHRCHRDLYHSDFSIGHISDDELPPVQKTICSLFGQCNPCDLKLKTNRFLQMGQCAVDVDKKEK